MQVPVYVLHAVGQCSNLRSLDVLYQHSVTLEGLQALSNLTGLQVGTAHHLVCSMGLLHKLCAPILLLITPESANPSWKVCPVPVPCIGILME